MSITELQQKLSRLPRFPGGSSFVILSEENEDSKLIVSAVSEDVIELELWFRTEAELSALLDKALAEGHTGKCRECGCTDDDCTGCVERTGHPCQWAAPNLCSACTPGVTRVLGVTRTNHGAKIPL